MRRFKKGKTIWPPGKLDIFRAVGKSSVPNVVVGVIIFNRVVTRECLLDVPIVVLDGGQLPVRTHSFHVAVAVSDLLRSVFENRLYFP